MSFFKNLFKEANVRDVVTLFHNAKNPASVRVHTLLKQTSANAAATATQDQASAHDVETKQGRTDFDLEIQEQPPTSDQLNSILEYLGPGHAGSVVRGAQGISDALKKYQQDASSFQSPVTVDWNQGKAVVGENESEILKLVRRLEADKA